MCATAFFCATALFFIRYFMKNKITAKVISQTIISILIVAIIIIFAIWSYNEAGEELIKNFSSYTFAVAKNNAHEIEEEFKDLTLLFDYISDAINKEGVNDEVLSSPYFKKVYSSIAEDFLILDEKGNTLFYTSSENSFLEPGLLKPVFLEVLSEEKDLPTPRISEYKVINVKNKKFGLFLFFKRFLYEPLNKNIYLTFIISGDRITDTYIKDLHLSNEGYAYIIDDDEYTIASGVMSEIGKDFDQVEDEELKEMLEDVKYGTEQDKINVRKIHSRHKRDKQAIFTKMVEGDFGSQRYLSREGEDSYEHISFHPIDVPGDTWSFAIKTPYFFIIDTLRGGFERTVALTALFILILFIDFVYIINNYKKRLTAELEVDHVSDLLEREQRLRRAKFRYKQLYQGTKDIILICDPDLMIEETNTAGVKAIGKNIKDITHKMKFSDMFISDEDLKEFMPILNKIGSVVNFQTTVKVGEETKYYEVSADKQIDEGDKKEYIYFIIRDMTEHNRLQKELINREKLESTMALIVTANHEINNPLAGIVLNIELMNNMLGEGDEKIKTIADDISRNVFRISDVLKRLSEIDSIKEKEYTEKVRMLDIDKSKTKH